MQEKPLCQKLGEADCVFDVPGIVNVWLCLVVLFVVGVVILWGNFVQEYKSCDLCVQVRTGAWSACYTFLKSTYGFVYKLVLINLSGICTELRER